MIQETSYFTPEEWTQFYQDICNELSIDPSTDWKHVQSIKDKLPHNYNVKTVIQRLMTKKTTKALIFGAAPSLELEFEYINTKYDLADPDMTLIAADGATTLFREHQLFPDIIVTDLDGIQPYYNQIARWPTHFFIHVHGDNQNAVAKFLPHLNFNKTVLTTQTREVGQIVNFGGFTDGDRALSIALSLGYMQILLVGFELEKKPGKYSKHKTWSKTELKRKKKKLEIAQRIISFLKLKSHKAIILVSNKDSNFRSRVDEFFKG